MKDDEERYITADTSGCLVSFALGRCRLLLPSEFWRILMQNVEMYLSYCRLWPISMENEKFAGKKGPYHLKNS